MPLFIFWIIFLLDLELNFTGKILVLRWELIVLLLLQICSLFVMREIIEAFISTSRYLDDLLNIDNIYFDQMVDRIYPTELQLNRANSSDTEAPLLDLNLCISNGTVSTKIYDKREDFDFDIVNFRFLDGDEPPPPSPPHPHPPPPTPAHLIWGIHISALDSPELLQTLVTLTTILKPLLPNFLGRAIVILNFVRRFRNFNADTVALRKNIASIWKHFCNKVYRNQNFTMT